METHLIVTKSANIRKRAVIINVIRDGLLSDISVRLHVSGST